MAVSGTSAGMEGPPVRRLLQHIEAQDPPGGTRSPQTRARTQNGSPGPGKSQGQPGPSRKVLGGENDTPAENPRPPGFEIPFWIFGKPVTFS